MSSTDVTSLVATLWRFFSDLGFMEIEWFWDWILGFFEICREKSEKGPIDATLAENFARLNIQ
jgi:hypothetical protein